jgi:hypothetical protein
MQMVNMKIISQAGVKGVSGAFSFVGGEVDFSMSLLPARVLLLKELLPSPRKEWDLLLVVSEASMLAVIFRRITRFEDGKRKKFVFQQKYLTFS